MLSTLLGNTLDHMDNIMKFTNKTIRKLEVPEDKKSIRVTITDNLSVLARRCSNGNITRSYCFRTTINGKRHQEFLGSVTDITLDMALTMLKERYDLAVRGYKPKEYIKEYNQKLAVKLKEQEYTLQNAFDDFLKTKAYTKNSLKHVNCVFRRLAPLKDKPLSKISFVEVRDIINQVIHSNAITQAKSITVFFNQLVDFAVNNEKLENNQFQKLKKLIPSHTPKHFKSVDPDFPEDGIKNILSEVISKVKNQRNINFIVFGFFVLVRPIEAASVELEDIDYKNNVVNIKKTKTGVTNFKVPITPEFKILLDKICDNEYPGRIFKADPDTIRKQILVTFNRNNIDFTLHGWRAAGMAWMVHNGINLFTAEACLTHAIGNAVTRAYMRSSLLQERREAMEKWHKFLYGVLKELKYFSD